MKVEIKISMKMRKKNIKREFKCDKCGASSLNTKMLQKKTFPHGRKSKPVSYNTCKGGCKKRIRIILHRK